MIIVRVRMLVNLLNEKLIEKRFMEMFGISKSQTKDQKEIDLYIKIYYPRRRMFI